MTFNPADTLRRIMTRALACLVAAVVLAGCGLAASPDRSQAAISVGIGEQDASMFTDPLFTKLKVKRARYFPSWNVALKKQEAAWLDIWVGQAQAARVEPLISFSAALGSRCPARPCKLPSVKEYTKAFKAFRKRWPQVKVVNPWNEANHRSQPTFRNPKRAAQYYNVVRSNCRGCKIVAADVIDERNMESWLKTFRRTAKKPKIWGLHNYRDTNLRKGQLTGGTGRLVKAVKGQIWLTETGGIVKFVLPSGGTLFPFSESRANKAVKRMFSLAKKYRSRIKRLYIYNWKQPLASNRFDAGLVKRNGKARPAYNTVRKTLNGSAFSP
jgi:Glycosyl hydrolase catalytic core